VVEFPNRLVCPEPNRLDPKFSAEPNLNVGRGVAEALRAVVVPSSMVKGLGELPNMEDPPKRVELLDPPVLPKAEAPVLVEALKDPEVSGVRGSLL